MYLLVLPKRISYFNNILLIIWKIMQTRCSKIFGIEFYIYTRFRWSRGSVQAFSTQVRGFKPGRSGRIFRAKKPLARLPSEGK